MQVFEVLNYNVKNKFDFFSFQSFIVKSREFQNPKSATFWITKLSLLGVRTTFRGWKGIMRGLVENKPPYISYIWTIHVKCTLVYLSIFFFNFTISKYFLRVKKFFEGDVAILNWRVFLRSTTFDLNAEFNDFFLKSYFEKLILYKFIPFFILPNEPPRKESKLILSK